MDGAINRDNVLVSFELPPPRANHPAWLSINAEFFVSGSPIWFNRKSVTDDKQSCF
jgi:hypothetical protein